jgi:hypothetical protein
VEHALFVKVSHFSFDLRIISTSHLVTFKRKPIRTYVHKRGNAARVTREKHRTEFGFQRTAVVLRIGTSLLKNPR